MTTPLESRDLVADEIIQHLKVLLDGADPSMGGNTIISTADAVNARKLLKEWDTYNRLFEAELRAKAQASPEPVPSEATIKVRLIAAVADLLPMAKSWLLTIPHEDWVKSSHGLNKRIEEAVGTLEIARRKP